jgi:glycosyltransferase involved in cell wall biosynthesis
LRRAAAEGATIVTSSQATALRAIELLDTDRVRVIHLGPPLPADSGLPTRRPAGINPTDDSPFLLAIGTTERRKNIPLLIRAFTRVAREHRSARLVIAGAAGDDIDAVHRAIGALQADVAARVNLLGRVDSAEKSWLLANARALAYPSLDEGFGFPILEAHAAKLPVVASTAGSIPEIAANAALLSPPKDVDGLAANLHWVLTNESIHTKLVRRGRRNLERFSWVTTGQELADLYRDLANGTPIAWAAQRGSGEEDLL